MKTRCLIIDDEPLAQEVLRKYIRDCPILELVSVCNNAFEAIEVLKTREIDIFFLDINMPGLSGISMVRSMKNPPQVIFTTAYPEYAVQGFELDAADYLVKPFSFERFMKAVNKAIKQYEYTRMKPADDAGNINNKYFLIKADGKLYRLDFDTVLYLEAVGDYVKIHTEEKPIVTHDTLKHFEKILPSDLFIRIHRSYIISLDKIRYIEGNRVRIKDNYLPVGASYRDQLIGAIDQRGELKN